MTITFEIGSSDCSLKFSWNHFWESSSLLTTFIRIHIEVHKVVAYEHETGFNIFQIFSFQNGFSYENYRTILFIMLLSQLFCCSLAPGHQVRINTKSHYSLDIVLFSIVWQLIVWWIFQCFVIDSLRIFFSALLYSFAINSGRNHFWECSHLNYLAAWLLHPWNQGIKSELTPSHIIW